MTGKDGGKMAAAVDAFPRLNALVVGDPMLDCYLTGSAGRICQEAPAPVVDISRRVDAPGGAANVAANLAALGARTTLLGVIGDDAEGSLLRDCLSHAGVEDALVVERGRHTLAKHRLLASSQLLVRFDQGSKGASSGESERGIIERLQRLYGSADAVVISDYAYGVLTRAVHAALAELRMRFPGVFVVDSRDLINYAALQPTAVKPNYAEACELLGERMLHGAHDRAEQISALGEALREATGARLAAVTMDGDGALFFEVDAAPYRTYARRTSDTRAAGAGDTFCAALALALAAGADGPAAAELASAAAAVAVAKEGTACCSLAEMRDAISSGGKVVSDLEGFAERLQTLRAEGRRIVFTNGCFDILHRGHVSYLNQAKALGDVLVVGVNSDSSVASLKGPGRPVNTLEDRLEVLGALSCIDHLVPFETPTPLHLVAAIRPDVFVKGGDYTRERLAEADLVESLGGVVSILPYLANMSTTGVIERIRANDRTPSGGV